MAFPSLSHLSFISVLTVCFFNCLSLNFRIRVYNLSIQAYPVQVLTGHTGSVQCIQCDDWKVISGDVNGFLCVWNQARGYKLWEYQSR